MYIKQIIIQGFKSYKEQTVIEPFSPKHNVIVGRNGSGKSNFFAAIRFVLSDAYTQMGKEERQALLHEGTGHAVMSAFVEIIFDNSDDRFPTGKPELVLRRTIGIKKDEYSLDRRNATKSDVMNLLESAGFSRSNPYYIVPQGRVTALTNMKDSERLLLLKEVAGTQVYEARRAESLKIMTDTDSKRANIDELMAYIKERLAELEEEKEELRDYEEKNKERRCLQYTIDHREQMAIASELESIEAQRQTGMDDTDDNRDRFRQGEKEMTEFDGEIQRITQEGDLLKIDKRQLETERRDGAKRKAKIELDLSSQKEGLAAAQKAKSSHAQEVQTITKSVKEHETKLHKLEPEFQKRVDEETRVRAEMEKADALRQRLYSKQGRNARFKSKKERDQWLQKEIDESYPQMTKIKAVRMQTEEEISELQKQISSNETDISSLRGQLDQRGTTSDTAQAQLQAKKAEVEKIHDERGELWREDAKLDTILMNVESEMQKAERTLSHRMDSDTSRGLAAVRRIKRQHNLDGLYGTLGELMEISDKFAIAIEATAGNSLFHYVVDNDETASKCLEILQKERSGRVTFMPLNRLKPKAMNLPKAADAVPMIEKLKYDPRHHKAFLQVFGKTIICPSLAVASQYARSHGVSAITMDGDRSDKKGALSGGFQDSRQSRLEAIQSVAKWRKESDTVQKRSSELKRAVEKKHQEVTMVKGELQKLEQTKHRQENSYLPLRQQLQSMASSLQNRRVDLESRMRALTNIDANMKALADQQSAHEVEKGTAFEKTLTKAEEDELEELGSSIPKLRQSYMDASSARSEIETRKSSLEIELTEHLRPRLDQLKGEEYDEQRGGSSAHLDEAEKELKRATKIVNTLEERLHQVDQSLSEASAQVAELEQQRAETRQQQEELAKSIERQQKRTEKGLQKKALLQRQAAEVQARVRDLGVLPQDAFTKYERMKSEAVVTRLRKVNDALKKYSHVNKKAFQQYEQFTLQREELSRRRGELDSSQASIEELIEVLDQRKDAAIERTFKQVSGEFASVFEALVPAGRGKLIIQRKTDRRQADEEEEEDEGKESVENYTGVAISVSFNSKHDEQQRIQQLSGGQKSLCALALVFAIQRCDPAPFYLFDEIDANLDAQYRTAVARMLQSLCARADDGASQTQNSADGGGHAQFICTTFRPEMLLVAEKCYGVRYVGKSSSVAAVSRDEAMDFVQGETRQ